MFQSLATRESIYLRRIRRIRRCGLVGGRVSLWGVGNETLLLTTWESVFSCLPLDEDVECLAPPAPCYVPTLMIMNSTSESVSQPQLNVVLCKSRLEHVSSQQ